MKRFNYLTITEQSIRKGTDRIQLVLTVGPDHGHDDGSGRRGALHQNGDEDADHQTDDGIGQQSRAENVA